MPRRPTTPTTSTRPSSPSPSFCDLRREALRRRRGRHDDPHQGERTGDGAGRRCAGLRCRIQGLRDDELQPEGRRAAVELLRGASGSCPNFCRPAGTPADAALMGDVGSGSSSRACRGHREGYDATTRKCGRPRRGHGTSRRFRSSPHIAGLRARLITTVSSRSMRMAHAGIRRIPCPQRSPSSPARAFIEHEQRLQSLVAPPSSCAKLPTRPSLRRPCAPRRRVHRAGEALPARLGDVRMLRQRIAEGLPVLGTCAGLILLADHFAPCPSPSAATPTAASSAASHAEGCWEDEAVPSPSSAPRASKPWGLGRPALVTLTAHR